MPSKSYMKMFHEEQNKPEHLKIGKIGEDIAYKYLKDKGYTVIERNFRRKWGEIDLVCSKNKKECSMWNTGLSIITNVLRGTFVKEQNVLRGTNNKKIVFIEVKTLKSGSELNPEDNLTHIKQKKLLRTCELYLVEKRVDLDIEWQIDAILVKLDIINKKANIKHLKNAIY